MASLGYTHNVRQNTLLRELPGRIREVHQIHDVNYGLIVSSLIITLALVALAWLVTVSTSHIQQINPEHDIAQSYAYTGPVSMQVSCTSRLRGFGRAQKGSDEVS